MGRNKRLFPVGKLILKTPEIIDKEKQYPIFLQYTWNRNPLTKQTGISCRHSDWNPLGNNKKGQIKSSYGDNYKQMNGKLQFLLSKYDDLLYKYALANPHKLNTDVVRAILHDEPITRNDKGTDFIEYGKKILENEYNRNRIKISAYKNGLSSFKLFGEFLLIKNLTNAANGIYIGDVTPEVIDELIAYRKNVKHNSDETINHALTPIIKSINEAANEGLADKTIANAINKMRIVIKAKLDDEEKKDAERHLSQEQISELIEYYRNCTEPRRKEYLEMFFFAYYACGLRCIDLLSLKWSEIDLKQKKLEKIQIKTSKRHIIPLNEQAIQILNSWKNRHQKYVFGLLPDDFVLDDSESLHKRRNSIGQSINQSLKVVGKHLGLDFNLTMHVARHSFAVHALNDGRSLNVVSRLLGHSSSTATEKVYAKYLPETLADEVAKLKFESLL